MEEKTIEEIEQEQLAAEGDAMREFEESELAYMEEIAAMDEEQVY